MRKPLIATAAIVSGVVMAGGTVTASSAHQGNVTRRLHYTDTTIRYADTGQTTFAEAGVDTRHGMVIGYSALTGKFNFEAHNEKVNVAVALKRGILLLGFTEGTRPGEFPSRHIHGRVLGGTRAFHHATGTFSAVQTNLGAGTIRADVTVRYSVRRP
jgi:hypothetical protein